MHFPHGPGGFGMFGSIFADILAGLAFLICFVVIVALLVVIVRFLLVATRAAEIYVAKNGPAQPDAPAATTIPVTTAPAPAAPRTRPTKTPPTT